MFRQLVPVIAIVTLTTAAVTAQDSPPPPDRREAPTEPAEVSDPAIPSPKLQEALDMIRRVEEFDKLVEELTRLRAENAKLRQELEKDTQSLPVITVRSKAISKAGSIAVLSIGELKLRVRENSSVMVSVNGGEATPLRVKAIKPESVELEFPDLQRSLVLNE